jgi:hypothetical protein
MTYEHQTKVLGITPDLEEQVKQLVAEGWEVVPNTMPVAIYYLRRQQAPMGAGVGGVSIDESKVHIIKASERPQ